MKSSEFPKSVSEALSVLADLASIGGGLDVTGGDGSEDGGTVVTARLQTIADADRAERRLQLAEARYQGLIEQIPAVTFLARLSGGKNEMYVSPQIEALLGFSQEEWLSDPTLWYRQTHPDDRGRVSRAFATSCLTGKPFRDVFRVLTRDGETVWVNAAAKLVRDAKGDLLFLQGVGFDVTEQFRAAEAREQLVREQTARAHADRDRARLREIFSNLPAAILLLAGPEHRVEIMNPIAQRLFGAGPEMIGKPLAQVVPDLKDLASGFRSVIFDKPLRRSDLQLTSPRWGRERFFDVTVQSMREYHGESLLLFAVETTEQVDAQRKVEQALGLRDDFIAIAAHELRTPVTSVMGQAQLALRRVQRDGALDPGRVNQSLDVIVKQAMKLSELITQLLDVSRLETGRLELSRERTDLVPLVDRVVATGRMLSERHPIIANLPPSLEADVDALRLEQVLTNLLQNAIKYSPKGGEIAVVLTEPDQATVEISVRDHGVGIPVERRDRIFERFYQAHNSRGQVGLGLGLYISREIVALHGGDIHAEFPDDGGTRFVVRLPRQSAV